MRPLDRKLYRDLMQTRGLLLAITSVLTVGVMCFVTMRSAYQNLEESRVRYYHRCRMADFWIDLKKVPVAEVARLEQLSGIASVESRIQFSVTVDLEGTVKPINGLVISLPAQTRPELNDIVIQQGGYFTSRDENEVIISDRFAREHGIFPGQSIHLLLNNRREELKVVGTANSSEFSYLLGPGALLPDPTSFGVFYVKRRYAEDVYDFAGAANQVIGRWSPGMQSRSISLLRQCEELLDDFGVSTAFPLSEQSSHMFLQNEIDGLEAFATVMPTIFLVVAALILNVLISRLVRQQRTMIGTLKALGYSNGRIMRHIMKLGVIVGVFGGVSGSVAGYLASAGMTKVYREYFEFPDMATGVYVETHFIGIASSVICSLLGSLNGARQAVRLQPAAAMRPAPPARGGAIWLEQASWLWGQLNAAWRLTMRGIFRNRMRSAMTVFSSMSGAALLISGFNLFAAQDYLIDFEFYRVNRSDLELSFQDYQDRRALDEILRLPGVDAAEAKFDLPCTLIAGPVRQKIGIQGIQQGARMTVPRDKEGSPIRLPEVGLVLGRHLAKKLHVGVGDSLIVSPSVGERRPVRVHVSRIVDGYIGLVVYADMRYLASLVNESFVMNRIQVQTSHVAIEEKVLFSRLREMPQVNAITNRRDLIASLQETLFANQMVMIVAIVGFAGVIFLGSVVNSSMINLAERQREVATLRAIGYAEWRIGGLFLRESGVTALMGTVLGIPAGYGIVYLISFAFNTDLARLPTITAGWGVIVTFGLAIVFVGLAHAVVQRAIHRLNYIEALNIKE